MTVAAPQHVPKAQTIAELWHRVGRVPLDRILSVPPPGTATESDLIALAEAEKRLCELVDGVLVEKTMGQYESRIAARLIYLLERFLEANDLGTVLAPDGPVRVRSGRVRMPDVGFVAWSHYPERSIPAAAILDRSPDLAVEVLSKSNTPQEMELKVHDYFRSGSVLVWLMDPRLRSSSAFTAPDRFVVHAEHEPLDAAPVLPGFRVSLKELIDRVGPPPSGE